MKNLNIPKSVGTAVVAGLLVSMAIANPNQSEYEEYAAQKLTEYLQQKACPQAPKVFGNSLKDECKSFVDSHPAEIKQIISQTTERYNFIVFSIYKTDLSISKVVPFLPANILPSYHFETLGVFQKFYLYQSEQQ